MAGKHIPNIDLLLGGGLGGLLKFSHVLIWDSLSLSSVASLDDVLSLNISISIADGEIVRSGQLYLDLLVLVGSKVGLLLGDGSLLCSGVGLSSSLGEVVDVLLYLESLSLNILVGISGAGADSSLGFKESHKLSLLGGGISHQPDQLGALLVRNWIRVLNVGLHVSGGIDDLGLSLSISGRHDVRRVGGTTKDITGHAFGGSGGGVLDASFLRNFFSDCFLSIRHFMSLDFICSFFDMITFPDRLTRFQYLCLLEIRRAFDLIFIFC